jgi:hypothetical protein
MVVSLIQRLLDSSYSIGGNDLFDEDVMTDWMEIDITAKLSIEIKQSNSAGQSKH